METSQRAVTTGTVSLWFGVSRTRIHQLDHVLRPVRDHLGHRRYDIAIVRAELKRRADSSGLAAYGLERAMRRQVPR